MLTPHPPTLAHMHPPPNTHLTPSTPSQQDVSEWDALEHRSMACPALPLCGLAVTEAERSLPTQNERIRAVMNKVGLPKDEFFHVRMTGMCCFWEGGVCVFVLFA